LREYDCIPETSFLKFYSFFRILTLNFFDNMKQLTTVILFLIVLLASCSQNKEYTITGTFSGDENNDKYVYIIFDSRNNPYADSALVQNKSFVFKGMAPDSVRIAYISCEKLKLPDMIIIEKGDIVISINSTDYKFTVSGTPLNDELQEYRDNFMKLITESMTFGEEMKKAFKSGNVTKEENIRWEARKDSVLNGVEDHVYNYAVKYANNPIGEEIFSADTYFMKPEKKEKLLSHFRPGFDGISPETRELMNNMKNTAVGKPYMDIKGFDTDGKPIAFSDFVGKGNIVLIDFWASWCGPCIASLPNVRKFYEKNKNKGLVILAVTLDLDKDKWLKATKEYNVDWPQLSNLKDYNSSAISYGIGGVPYNILIGKNGIIAAREISVDLLQGKFDELVNEM